MYFIRTLPMTPGTAYSFDRHFNAARNPTRVNVVRSEVIPTPMGELRVVLVECECGILGTTKEKASSGSI